MICELKKKHKETIVSCRNLWYFSFICLARTKDNIPELHPNSPYPETDLNTEPYEGG
jgi:hypothetical protein